MEGIIWTDLVINAEELHKVKGERKRKMKANSIGAILHGTAFQNALFKGR